MSSSDEFDEPEGKKENDQKSESDIKSNDNFGEDDYYNNNIEEYKNAEYTPSVDPPKEITFSTRKPNDFRPARVTNETFMNFNEKFQKIKNEEYNEEEFPTSSAEEMCENHKTTFNKNIDYSLNIYDTFSKNHLRNTLLEQIKKIDWVNQRSNIDKAKKETNAYEGIYEHFFDKNQGYQLANINYLFEKKLIIHDNLFDDGIPVFITGDNGGFTDYILYYAIYKKGFFPTIFVIPEKNNSIKTTKFRREIKDKVSERVEILDEFYQENKDLDENESMSVDFINNIVSKINDKTSGYMINLYIARKVIKFEPDSSQEIKYKKFLLINILLAFKLLNTGGNFIIKLYDTFSPFTIGLIYIIFKNFENVSIFKPVSTRQYSPCRFLVAENYLKIKDEETNSIKYLENFLTKYIEFTKDNYDVKYFLPSVELRKNEKFLKIIPEINNEITEKRIDALKDIINNIDNRKTKIYDKMAIKKFFLDNWGVPVIDYDEKKLLKNQMNYNKGKNDYYNRKTLTEEERAEAYKNVGVFDKDQIKMLNLMKQSNKNHRKKTPVKQETKPPENLEDKYKKINEILNMKKLNKKTKKNDNEKGKNTESKKKNEENTNKDKELLKKKIERREIIDKRDEKTKNKIKKNNDGKNDIKKDNNIALNESDEEERPKKEIDEKTKKKLLKYKKK